MNTICRKLPTVKWTDRNSLMQNPNYSQVKKGEHLTKCNCSFWVYCPQSRRLFPDGVEIHCSEVRHHVEFSLDQSITEQQRSSWGVRELSGCVYFCHQPIRHSDRQRAANTGSDHNQFNPHCSSAKKIFCWNLIEIRHRRPNEEWF